VCYAGSSKLLSSDANKKAAEAVKTGRLVVTGQLLQILSSSQRPRPAAATAVFEKKKIGPLTWKFHDNSTKGFTRSENSTRIPWKFHDNSANCFTGSDAVKTKRDATGGILKLQRRMTDSVQRECVGEDMISDVAAAETVTVDADEAFKGHRDDTFCPKITSIVSLEENSDPFVQASEHSVQFS